MVELNVANMLEVFYFEREKGLRSLKLSITYSRRYTAPKLWEKP